MTDVQCKLFTAIVRLRQRLGYAPSVRELCAETGVSLGCASANLQAMKKARVVTWVPGANRTLSVVRKDAA